MVWARIRGFERCFNLKPKHQKEKKIPSNRKADFTDYKIDIKFHRDFEYLRKYKGNHMIMA